MDTIHFYWDADAHNTKHLEQCPTTDFDGKSPVSYKTVCNYLSVLHIRLVPSPFGFFLVSLQPPQRAPDFVQCHTATVPASVAGDCVSLGIATQQPCSNRAATVQPFIALWHSCGAMDELMGYPTWQSLDWKQQMMAVIGSVAGENPGKSIK